MLAPIIKLMPAAIEKNAVAEEMSRMVGEEIKSTLQHEPGLSSVANKHYGDSRALLEYSHSICISSKRKHPLKRIIQ